MQPTPHEDIDRYLAELSGAKQTLHESSVTARAAWARDCLGGVCKAAGAWIEAACHDKGIDLASPAIAEEIMNGPMATARSLRLIAQSLENIHQYGAPMLPGKARQGPSGQTIVPVFPTQGSMFDGFLFSGFRANVWLKPGVTLGDFEDQRKHDFQGPSGSPAVNLVLGAGNVTSIAATDTLGKLLHDGHTVLLKMNPVNESLGDILQQAFSCLIEQGFLRIIYGGADVGAFAVAHRLVDEVHITGSAATHDAIVWGGSPQEREQRKAEGNPLLKKRITSELGNVTPWIVIPGPYTDRELDFQAENVVATITNNASFNCVATQIIVTHKGWDQRDQFLDKIATLLAAVPPRRAYYPGAVERYRQFAKEDPVGNGEHLPWKLLRNVQRSDDACLFREESFVCVAAETAIEATDTNQFVDHVADFVNEECWGTLGAGVMVHPTYRRQEDGEAHFQNLISRLRYGTVAINHWPGLAFGMMSSPWGGFPGSPLEDPQSGMGWVHNVYQLTDVEKTVLEGPLVVFPKPVWFPQHRCPTLLANRVLRLYSRPAWWRLPGVFTAALSG